MTDRFTELGLSVQRASPRLAASWRRSERYGIDLDAVRPAFTGAYDTGSLLYECGHTVLTDLQSTLGSEPISLMLADREGVVLSRVCNDAAIVRTLDRVHLAPGFSYAEENAGTNGLGLSLADRAPTLVRGRDHYCTALRGYTCAAVPVFDPRDGSVAGSVNLTTWSTSSSELLLALAQAAAGGTAALMAARAGGRTVRPTGRGEVFRVIGTDAVGDLDACVSPAWRRAVDDTREALASRRLVAVVGEDGAGKAAAVAHARRADAPRERILRARTPAGDVGAWLALWLPELETPGTTVVVSRVEALPGWAAVEVARAVARSAGRARCALTVPAYGSLPAALAEVVATVVEVPPLRDRPQDVVPLALHVARQERHRAVALTATARRALTAYAWPGNATQLRRVVREAAARADIIDVQHLDPAVLSHGRHTLSRLETLERDEIVRCLTAPGTTIAAAAATLGLGRATLYRKIAQYGIDVPRQRGGGITRA